MINREKGLHIVFPSIDPGVKKSLNTLYENTRNLKDTNKRKNIMNTNSRRCNRCGGYFDTTETELHRYYPASKRKYRLCKACVEHFEVCRIFRKQSINNHELEA